MSQRTRKASSLIQHIVAGQLPQLVGNPGITVTGVTVSPDMRQATVWVSVLAVGKITPEQGYKQIESSKAALQSAVAEQMATKFAPRLHLKLDTGGEYAAHITTLINGIEPV